MRSIAKKLSSIFLVMCMMVSLFATTAMAATAPTSSIVITKQPVDTQINLGEKVSFSINATGEGLSYQWYYMMPGKGSSVLWEGKTKNTVTYTPAMKNDGMKVYCKVSSTDGTSVNSKMVTLTYNHDHEIDIYRQSGDVNIQYGEKAKFTVEATGRDLKFQWYYKMPGKDFVEWTGKTKYEVSYTPALKNDGLVAYCEITDRDGKTVNTNPVKLTFYSDKPLAVLTQPKDLSVKVGDKATFTCEALGNGVTYQWYYAMNGKTTFTEWTGKTSTSVTLTTALKNNNMKIYCVAKDKDGVKVTSDTVTLKVNTDEPLKINTQPENLALNVGDKATLTCEATGSNVTYQWYYALKGKETFTLWDGKTKSVATLVTTEKNDGMRFYCKVTDGNDKSIDSNIVSISFSKIEITTQPQDMKMNYGDDGYLTVEAQGEGLKYEWYVNGKATGVSGRSLYLSPNTVSAWTDITTPFMNDETVTLKFTAVISDGSGSVTSDEATVTYSCNHTTRGYNAADDRYNFTTGEYEKVHKFGCSTCRFGSSVEELCKPGTASYNGDLTHSVKCSLCEQAFSTEKCTDKNADSKCDVCKATMACSHVNRTSFKKISNTEHSCVCSDCNESITEPHNFEPYTSSSEGIKTVGQYCNDCRTMFVSSTDFVETPINVTVNKQVDISGSANNYQVFAFKAPAAGTYVITSSGDDDADTKVYVYNASKVYIDENDDGGLSCNFKYEFTAKANQTFYFLVDNTDYNRGWGYSVKVTAK